MPTSPARTVRPATLAQAAVPVGLLVGLLAGSVALFGDASSSGPNQIALMLAAGAGAIVGLRNGHTWPAIERGINDVPHFVTAHYYQVLEQFLFLGRILTGAVDLENAFVMS